VLGQDGTRRDAAGYRLLSIPGSCEVRARFCKRFRTTRRGFDSRRLRAEHPAAPSNQRALAGLEVGTGFWGGVKAWV
jgi:hypothetical protein